MGIETRLSLRRYLGFEKRYKFVLWSIFSLLIAALGILRAPLLTEEGFRKHTVPGEWYWYKQLRIGMTVHLLSIIPIGLLVPLQFIPALRKHQLHLHRLGGYAVFALLIPAIGSAISMIPHAFGGRSVMRGGPYVLVIITPCALFKAWIAIRRQQIDEHRKWILRAMFWMSTIIGQRILLAPLVLLLAKRGLSQEFTCDEARVTFGNNTIFSVRYPQCNTLGPNDIITVPGEFTDRLTISSVLRTGLAWGSWIAFFIEAVGVELYIYFTKEVNLKLKKQSQALRTKTARLAKERANLKEFNIAQ